MRYFLAILLPPVAVLLCGKPVQFVLNIILTLLGFVPGIVHALLVVNDFHEDRRAEMIVRAVRGAGGVPVYR